MSRIAVAAVLSVLALSACGGASKAAGPPSLQDVAVKAGCPSIGESSDELYVREGGTCTAGPDEVTVHTYADAKARDAWLDAASSFGGIVVVGDLWTVGVDDQAAAERVKARTGGEIR